MPTSSIERFGVTRVNGTFLRSREGVARQGTSTTKIRGRVTDSNGLKSSASSSKVLPGVRSEPQTGCGHVGGDVESDLRQPLHVGYHPPDFLPVPPHKPGVADRISAMYQTGPSTGPDDREL